MTRALTRSTVRSAAKSSHSSVPRTAGEFSSLDISNGDPNGEAGEMGVLRAEIGEKRVIC